MEIHNHNENTGDSLDFEFPVTYKKKKFEFLSLKIDFVSKRICVLKYTVIYEKKFR